MNKNSVDDAMRKEIVEYLLKGIRKSIISLMDEKSTGGVILEEHEGFIKNIFKTILGKFIASLNYDEDNQGQENAELSFVSGSGSVMNHVSLVEKRSINRESKREVII